MAELLGAAELETPALAEFEPADPPARKFSWTRAAPLGLVAFAVAFSAVLLRSELRVVSFPNDAGGHQALVRFAAERIRAGHNPFDAWFPYLGLGSPLFSQYQSLSHIITGALSIPFGLSVYRWIGYALLCT